jgi:hypothetical protein
MQVRIPAARQAALSRAALLDHYHHNELVMPSKYTCKREGARAQSGRPPS